MYSERCTSCHDQRKPCLECDKSGHSGYNPSGQSYGPLSHCHAGHCDCDRKEPKTKGRCSQGKCKDKKHDCPSNQCPPPRVDCEKIDIVRVGVFAGSQPTSDVFPQGLGQGQGQGECQRVVGFDVEMAWEIYHNRLGYDVQFYQVNTQNAGLNQLLCGLVDVVASSTVDITPQRRQLANYIQTDAPPRFLVGAIVPKCVGCTNDTLKDLWLDIGGQPNANGCPCDTHYKVARNSIGTTQSNILRMALGRAYPNCSMASLDAYYLQQTVDVRQFTCAQIVQGFGTLYRAAVIGPRGDVSQLQPIYDALPTGQYALCPSVGTIDASARGWAMRSCKLTIETQRAFDELLCDGTYDSLVVQSASFPYFTEACLLAGIGQTYLVRPSKKNLSITSGFVDTACISCMCDPCLRNPKCPCEKPAVRPHPLTGRIICLVPYDCSQCECSKASSHSF